MIDQPLILITLLIQLGVSAAVSSVLARSRRFRVLLFHEDRDIWEKLEMVLNVGGPFMLGVVVRATVKNFLPPTFPSRPPFFSALLPDAPPVSAAEFCARGRVDSPSLPLPS